jgi:hypothetical protein
MKTKFLTPAFEQPFFIEATEDTIMTEVEAKGIKGGSKLPPPYIGVSKNGIVYEMFRHTTSDKKRGWMIHDSGRRIKQEFINKYHNN